MLIKIFELRGIGQEAIAYTNNEADNICWNRQGITLPV